MSAIARLIEQHRGCDDFLVRAEAAVRDGDWTTALAAWQPFEADMQRHFALEEEHLFPAFEAATGMTMGPTAVMRGEHAEMRELFAELRAALAAQDSEAFLGQGETLLILMQQHNMKEENVLYPMCAQHVAEFETLVPQS
ncbi:hemerythrin domain-containing protein [Paludibacterium purpuratum]|uniref:Hemerythrin HHE cation binding domain-containing protein n=1 Tax=Paludibacterium purpuratum TaxID=1144873 RepID=A0A4R7BCB8_9NEIS|nr:hemerythrin domain-containing protein [Paludibacterium purpuratum]TDR81366.1 hemerythrin HHE cation binding domain-containing protein [Paludibacterium purpuratum]